MTALTNLMDSDTLFFDFLAFNLVGPGKIDPGPKRKTDLCIPKTANQLHFKLNSIKHLGVKDPFDFDVDLMGQPAGNNLNGETLIIWNVDQMIDRDYSVSPGKLHIGNVKGSILTAIRARNPRTQGKDCSGADRSIGVDLETQPGENQLIIQGVYSLSEGIDIDVKASADNISFAANGGELFTIDARINVVRDECGIGGVVPGGAASFWAQVENVPLGAAVKYAWSASSGSPTGATDQSSFHLQLGDSLDPIDVQVVVTIEGISQAVTSRYFPDTAETVRIKELRCRVLSLLRFNMFVDPLWDPLRDYVTHPLSRSELQRMQAFAASLVGEIDDLRKLEANYE